MASVHPIRANINLIKKVENMNWKRDNVSENDKKVFKLVASNPKKMFSLEELAKELNMSEEDVLTCAKRLDSKDLIHIDFWQAVIVDGVIYDDWDVVGRMGIHFPEEDY